ncbi:hypothetical protein [Pseudomonas syringae]|uniref:hypothetical protein n=1 Tax=Pseudomonas syringae TaxID=317 RepID=UPI001BCC6D8D|nr:hypothetical protein [Pseudomonas syringae]MBS7413751.1 hypothetical protein [Pseudomonas syringae]
MYKKLPENKGMGIMTPREALSRLAMSNPSGYCRNVVQFGSLLTEDELQSLRQEMIIDAKYMKEWLRSKPIKIIR